MLLDLQLHGVGPATKLAMSPVAPRLNLVTGDNGLGKSFLLETAWWAMTRTWHGTPAVPTTPKASIGFAFDGATTSRTHRSTSRWDPSAQAWKRAQGRPPNPGLVIYARVDGSYSVWDPARNYRLYQRDDGGESQSPPSYQFGPDQVLEGLRREVVEGGRRREQVLCKGLIDDWTRWQDSGDRRFDILASLLAKLGPEDQALVPGEPRRPTLDDERLIPTIRMPYGQDVPITYAPAGVQRMSKLAYLLAWSLSAHKEESKRIGQPSSKQIIVLIDEPETHLHPRWQRTVLPSLLSAISHWDVRERPDVQLLVATHSPLVLVSLEPIFDPSRDALWKLDLVDGDVALAKDEWHKRGNAERWLVSDVFDLQSTAARENEQLLLRAGKLLDAERPKVSDVKKVDAALAEALPDMDPFFVRWRYHMRAVLEGKKR